jgi:hypothetical protein
LVGTTFNQGPAAIRNGSYHFIGHGKRVTLVWLPVHHNLPLDRYKRTIVQPAYLA